MFGFEPFWLPARLLCGSGALPGPIWRGNRHVRIEQASMCARCAGARHNDDGLCGRGRRSPSGWSGVAFGRRQQPRRGPWSDLRGAIFDRFREERLSGERLALFQGRMPAYAGRFARAACPRHRHRPACVHEHHCRGAVIGCPIAAASPAGRAGVRLPASCALHRRGAGVLPAASSVAPRIPSGPLAAPDALWRSR